MKSLSSYISNIITESNISNKDFKAARQLIKSYLDKHKIYTMPDIEGVEVDGVKYYGNFVFNSMTDNGAYFLWKQSSITTLDGIVLSSNASNSIYAIDNGMSFVGDVSIKLSGCSLAKLLPFVKDVVLGKIAMESRVIKKYLDNFIVYDNAMIEESVVIESESAEVQALKKRKTTLFSRIAYNKKKGKDYSELQQELDDINSKLADLQVHVSRKASVVPDKDEELDDLEQEFEERATPKERFKDMEHYVKMVLKGLQPSLLICGAPGVGKTYRVMEMVKKNHTMGDNLFLIKAKCTPQAFYMTLFDYKHKGDIIVIDDADSLLEDDTSVNLLKAATDSSDERWVSYGTSKPPLMSEDQYMALDAEDQALCTTQIVKGGQVEVHFYPKSFAFEGSIIIITNKNAGSIDTAIRNRALVCDLEFNTEELLGIVKDIMPAIGSGSLSSKDKIKALEYLQDMAQKGSKMEISIRSFTTVAKLFAACEGDDDSAQRMIREQMRLQFARNKKHY